MVTFADCQVCTSRRRYLISFLYAHICFRLQLAIFHTCHFCSRESSRLLKSRYATDFWGMFCEWFPSCFITSLERLDLCLHHMCLHSLDSCSEVGKDSPKESVYAMGFIPVTLLIVVKNTRCFLVYREQPSEFLGQMWSHFLCN